MYTEGNFIYAEHNMMLIDKTNDAVLGPRVSIKRYTMKDLVGNILEKPIEMTQEYYYEVPNPVAIREEIEQQIADLKAQLVATDYQCLKFVEGYLTENEYKPIKEQRQCWRDKINELEQSLDD